MRTRPGVTLIEVSIAALITAMTSAAVFSIVLSGLVSHEKADKRELAAMAIKRASQSLSNYVSAVPSESAYTPVAGGKWAASATAGWSLRGNTGGGVTHDISSLLNGTELQVPGQTCAAGNAYCFFTYTVVDYDCGLGTANTAWACKRVTFNLRYAD